MQSTAGTHRQIRESARDRCLARLFFVLLTKELINEKLRLKNKHFHDGSAWNKPKEEYKGNESFRYEDSSVHRKLAKIFIKKQP